MNNRAGPYHPAKKQRLASRPGNGGPVGAGLACFKDLEEFLFARALEHESPKLLFRLACEYLSSSRLIRPGVVHVLQRVATARKRARGETWQRMEPMLTRFLRGELDGMLVPDPLLGRTRLAWLGTGPTSSAPAAVKGELEKLAYLRGMDAHSGAGSWRAWAGG
jgi:hypothetical protein